MPQMDFLAKNHVVVGLYPVADAFAGGVSSDIVSLSNYRKATFFVFTGAIEDAGISNLVTVEACQDNAGTNHTAVAFKSRTILSSTTVDVEGALTDRASTGYNFALANAVANAVWVAEVVAEDIEAALPGYNWVRLTIAETVDKTITAMCLIVLSEPRYGLGGNVSAIA